MLQTIYTFLLGLLTTAVVQVGIATFYRAPEGPDYQPADPTLTPEEQRDRSKADHEQRQAYQKLSDRYYSNFAIITMAFVIIQLAIGLTLATKLGPLADGILLGGIFSLAFGVGICFRQNSRAAQFMIVLAAFVIALVLGYLKFMPH